MKIDEFLKIRNEVKELLPCEINPKLKECLMCRRDKEDVTTRDTEAGPLYSCGECHSEVQEFWKEPSEKA